MGPRTRKTIGVELLADEWKPRIKKLINGTTAASKTDVFKRALIIFGELHQHQEDGWEIVLRKGKEEKAFNIS